MITEDWTDEDRQPWDAYHTTDATRREFLPEGTLERRPLLDKPSDPHPILSALMDEALLRIMLTADGGVMALKERVSGGGAGTQAPSSSLAGLLDGLGERFAACKTHRGRLAVIKEAQMQADKLQYAPDRSLIRGTPEWRQRIAADPRSCRVLATIWDVHYVTISRIKKKAGK